MRNRYCRNILFHLLSLAGDDGECQTTDEAIALHLSLNDG